MVDNLTKNWKGIKLCWMLSFLMLFSHVFSWAETMPYNNVISGDENFQTITGTIISASTGESLIGQILLSKAPLRVLSRILMVAIRLKQTKETS